MKRKTAYQFRIELQDLEPPIWRLIEVPSRYNFWDLHVAIQDSMGWLDYHLHSFSIIPPRKRKPILIGIPDDEYEDPMLPGWEIPVAEYFDRPGDEAMYEYDFGDDWSHKIILNGILLQDESRAYPNCVDGKRACPPEDCGGVPGYYSLVKILRDKNHEEHEDMVSWLRNHAKCYWPYDPDSFEANEVVFSNPKKRWKRAFQS